MMPNFPTNLLPPRHPSHPTPPPEQGIDDEAALARETAFLEEVRSFFDQMFAYTTLVRNYSEAASFYVEQKHAQGMLQIKSQVISHEAINSVTKNMAPTTLKKYLWDAQGQRWVLQVYPL